MITFFNNKIVPKALILGLTALLFTISSGDVLAQNTKPVQVSLINPIQIFPEGTAIKGIRLNLIYGKNVAVTGLDLGLVNQTGSGGFTGLEYGFVNISDATVKGAQFGVVNFAKGNVSGVQWGPVNTAPDMKGFQYGFVNHAGDMNGLQLGLVNYAEFMNRGLQIGLLNIIREGGKFPIFPIVNWSF